MEYKSLDSERRFKSSSFLKTSGVSGIASSYFFGETVPQTIVGTISSASADSQSSVLVTSKSTSAVSASTNNNTTAILVDLKSVTSLPLSSQNSTSTISVNSTIMAVLPLVGENSQSSVSVVSGSSVEIHGATADCITTISAELKVQAFFTSELESSSVSSSMLLISGCELSQTTDSSQSLFAIDSTSTISIGCLTEPTSSLIDGTVFLSVSFSGNSEDSVSSLDCISNSSFQVATSSSDSISAFGVNVGVYGSISANVYDSTSQVLLDFVQIASCDTVTDDSLFTGNAECLSLLFVGCQSQDCQSVVITEFTQSCLLIMPCQDSTASIAVETYNYVIPVIRFNVNPVDRIKTIGYRARILSAEPRMKVWQISKKERHVE